MIVRMLVRLFGGIWKLKKRCNVTKNKLIRKYLIKLYRAYQFNHGASIAWNARFEGVPCLPHSLHGIFVSGTSKVGKNCVIFHQVTIGSNTLVDSKGKGSPTIGDNCYIGAGVKIIGNVKVGNNVRIGANAVVYKDVPNNSIVISNEQKIIGCDQKINNKFHAFYQNKWCYYNDELWIEEKDEVAIEALQFSLKSYAK